MLPIIIVLWYYDYAVYCVLNRKATMKFVAILELATVRTVILLGKRNESDIASWIKSREVEEPWL